jgi:GntR family transcriptional regulator/MocR family aminotransferase
MREVYAERLSVLIESARARLAGLLEVAEVEAGLQTVGWLAGGLDSGRAAAAAARREVEVAAVDPGDPGAAPRQGLHLGFAAVGATEIRRGVEELGRALEEVAAGQRREPGDRHVSFDLTLAPKRSRPGSR